MLYSPEILEAGDASLKQLIGGKGAALLRLYKNGFPVPKPIFLGTGCYEEFVERNGLREKLQLVLHRKDLREMRWEEIWDNALRIQGLFLRADMPSGLAREIEDFIAENCAGEKLVVRSSAPGEDSESQSFAGLHSSIVGVKPGNDVLKAVKKVWASLWSDRAILYRQELGLKIESSAMAVVLQELIEGECSGVVFSRNPLEASQMVIEAVHGLNDKLVDGDTEPDRWFIDRQSVSIVGHHRPGSRHEKGGMPDKGAAPLTREKIQQVAGMALSLEQLMGRAQDIEWTFANSALYILQSRPVTAEKGDQSSDKRAWYLSLTRSYENLLGLWQNISENLLPAMDEESESFAAVTLETLPDDRLASQLRERNVSNEKWTGIYWSEFIPFAHGVRLFGEVYNDLMEPVDPFEFVVLLTGQEMLSTRRNRTLYDCAQLVKQDRSLRELLEKGRVQEIDHPVFQEKVHRLKHQFAMTNHSSRDEDSGDIFIASVILQYAELENFPPLNDAERKKNLEAAFLEQAAQKLPFNPLTLLDMARSSYRLRDDDNIHIGRVAQQLERAVLCAKKRLSSRGLSINQHLAIEDLAQLLTDPESMPVQAPGGGSARQDRAEQRVYARQLQGQPASAGIATGVARVITEYADLKDFRRGEILVIDSLDPTMTFFAPLAAGIIERRGGMLIHGAIIAREYGVPCITGVAAAAYHIATGDRVTVDGFLGICTIQRENITAQTDNQ